MGKNIILKYFLLIILIALPLKAIEPDCPWVLSNIYTPEALENIDPSERIALQNILQGVYKKPFAKMSTADLKWIDEYALHDVVADLIKVATDKHKINSKEHLNKTTRKTLTALGMALSAAGLFYITSKESEKKSSNLLNELNDTYGLNLVKRSYESDEDLEFLKKIIECAPNHSKKALKKWIYDYDKIPTGTKQAIKYNILSTASIRGLATFLMLGDEYDSHFYDLLKKYWKDYNLIFCTAFGNPRSYDNYNKNIIKNSYLDALSKVPFSKLPKPIHIVQLDDMENVAGNIFSNAIDKKENVFYINGRSSPSFFGFVLGQHLYQHMEPSQKEKINNEAKACKLQPKDWIDVMRLITNGRDSDRYLVPYPEMTDENKFAAFFALALFSEEKLQRFDPLYEKIENFRDFIRDKFVKKGPEKAKDESSVPTKRPYEK